MTANPDDELELTIDKFIFRFPGKLRYSEAGLWIRHENGLLRMGLSDFAQQRSGDIAFAIVTPAGTVLEADDDVASIETVKVNLSLPSPVKGKIVEVNSKLQESPELINQDPYGGGWIALVQPENLELDLIRLMSAEAYCKLARQQAEVELKV